MYLQNAIKNSQNRFKFLTLVEIFDFFTEGEATLKQL